ncbi:phospholipid-binding protein MlaC [Puniceibacterium sp. IMCC21224]|uniref:MlaC/ttg2D family ABC transporter substrate-binding protein n=1 Tax=Puniceibacterium sp. IMCC21224 TaxID=1618204 RepID=UPI00064DB78B|nr:ABC transporter substrate-binding protein [Puniceibacterium sp. IMCC21224]KMK65328.1 ABC-type transport system, auxiliary component [Puniceibacterium sp. IMCC21224]
MRFIETRRGFLIGAATTGAGLMLPSGAWALSEGQARTLVEKVVAEIYRVIESGKPERALVSEFQRIFQAYSDTSYVAAYAMGNDARRATSAQKAAFSTAFNAYLARKYGKQFRDFVGGRVEVQEARSVKNYVEVRATAYLRAEAPFDMTFHVSDRTGSPRFFNMYVEGINMLLTERTEVGSMIDRRRGDLDAMIQDLKSAG